MKQIIFSLSIIFFFINIGIAQKIYPNDGIVKYRDNELLVKWQPKSIEEWMNGISNGYTVTVFKNGNEIANKSVKPSSYDEIIKTGNNKSPFLRQFYNGAAGFLYPENINDEDRISNILEDQSQRSEVQWNLAFLMYSCIYDFDLAQLSGLGVGFNNIENADFIIKVETKGYAPHTISYFKNVKQKLIKAPVAEWGDKIMEVTWDTKELTAQYYGYILEKSFDGRKFIKSDSLPYVNNQEIDPNSALGYKMMAKDSLEFNNRTYYYRLRGLDYFGEWSNDFQEFSGQGIDALNQSPVIVYADQTENNDAHLKWKFPSKDIKLIKYFTIYRSDSINGKYEVAVDSVNKFERELRIPMIFTQNYFRIVARPNKGAEVGSMPVLVMGQDNEPPMKPELVSSVVDKNGYVAITIKKNHEKDLWGYRLFKSNFKSDEFSLMNASPTLDTILRDTVNLKLGIDNIFYFVEVADLRNNRSPLSDTITLELPDIIPPNSPIIQKLEQLSDSLKINWRNSNSKDVVSQSLFRREINNEETWTKIFEFDSSYQYTQYYDVKLKVGGIYAYTMTATDDAGLESKPIDKKEIQIKALVKEFIPFEKINYEIIDDGKRLKLSWLCNDPDDLVSVLVYKGFDKEKLNRYEEVKVPIFYLDDEFISGQNVYYLLKPKYKIKKGIFKKQEIIEVVSIGK
ncbi:MAG: hypothetical protein KA536_06445 [Saprospiraceae bacterium]|nr:hypothetical protein [Saprospiraceae bacterium]